MKLKSLAMQARLLRRFKPRYDISDSGRQLTWCPNFERAILLFSDKNKFYKFKRKHKP